MPQTQPTAPERTFAGYRLGACLGRGGFATVYRATRLDADGAPQEDQPERCLKIGYEGGGGENVTRVERYSERPTSRGVRPGEFIAAGLRHHTGGATYGAVSAADIATILADEHRLLTTTPTGLLPAAYEAGEADGRPYYALEYIPGITLRDFLHRARPANLDFLSGRFAALLAGLHEALQRDPTFYHGDLKPENIIMAEGRFRPIDPALRPDDSRPLAATLTVPYNPLGLRGERADTFAIAAILLEIVTGEAPFGGYSRPFPLAAGPVWKGNTPLTPERFLGLGRFAPHRKRPLVPRLLDWLRQPPTYAEMRAALGPAAPRPIAPRPAARPDTPLDALAFGFIDPRQPQAPHPALAGEAGNALIAWLHAGGVASLQLLEAAQTFQHHGERHLAARGLDAVKEDLVTLLPTWGFDHPANFLALLKAALARVDSPAQWRGLLLFLRHAGATLALAEHEAPPRRAPRAAP